MKSFVVTSFLLAVLLHVAESAEYNRHVTLKPGVFNVSWYYNATNTRFYFRIQANTTGWAALGLTYGDGNHMMHMDLDIALGGVKAGTAYLNDYVTKSRGKEKPELDGQQDLTLTSGTETGGKTVLEFNHLADTTDTLHDLKLKDGEKVTLCFAMAANDTTNSTTFSKHTSSDRGCTPVKYDMYRDESAKLAVNQTTAASELMLSSLMVLILAQVVVGMVY